MIYFYYFSSLSSLLPAFLFLKWWRNMEHSNYNKLFLTFLLYRCITDVISLFLEKQLDSSLPMAHFTVVCEGVFYLELARSQALFKTRSIRMIQASVLLIALIEFLTTCDFWVNNWYATIYTYSLVILVYFFLVVRSKESLQDGKKLFAVSVFTYYSTLILYFIFEDIIRSDLSLYLRLFPFIYSFVILYNVVLFYAIYLNRKKNLFVMNV
ncbi:MAG: hypothetical protein RIS20_2115 [Bacteroidota bacterium]|jgi:hypothetical protein